MIIPVCQQGSCSIHIAYNQQIPLCTKSSSPPPSSTKFPECRQVSDLCLADPKFNFSSEVSNDGTYVVFKLDQVLGTEQLLMKDWAFKSTLPLPIHTGGSTI